jgi:hypothetical protein
MIGPSVIFLFRITTTWARLLRVIPFEWDPESGSGTRARLRSVSRTNLVLWEITKFLMISNQFFLIIRSAQSIFSENKQSMTNFILELLFTGGFSVPILLQTLLSLKRKEILHLINQCLNYYGYIYGKA